MIRVNSQSGKGGVAYLLENEFGIALPKDICDTVYATDGYGQSVANLARVSLQSDMVFGDDGAIRFVRATGIQ